MAKDKSKSRTTFYLPLALHDWLKHRATDEHIRINEVVLRVVRRYVEAEQQAEAERGGAPVIPPDPIREEAIELLDRILPDAEAAALIIGILRLFVRR